MGKRRQGKRDDFAKRAKLSAEIDIHQSGDDVPSIPGDRSFHIQRADRIEDKVDLIIKDVENNSQKSLTIWGYGLGVEKTIAVVEAIKRNYTKYGKIYHEEVNIKSDESNQPHLQVILTPTNNGAN